MEFSVVNFFLNLAELNFVRDFSLSYDALVELVASVVMLFTLLIIMVTPVFLLYFWGAYSVTYVKKYRSRFSLKKLIFKRADQQLGSAPYIIWYRYRRVYSRLLGFGFAIAAYGFSSILFMSHNFNRFEHGLAEYFNFPFKVLKSFDPVEASTMLTAVDSTVINMEEMWSEMIYIVVISVIFFLIGYVLGSFIVDWRYKQLNRKLQRPVRSKEIKFESALYGRLSPAE